MKPFVLNAGQGETRNYGIPHIIKLGELNPGRGAAVFEYKTKKGEEPPLHTHKTEDEIFYVLKGELTYHCDGKDFPAKPGSFVFLPKGLKHGYTITSDDEVHLLVMTFPVSDHGGKGWGGYLADVESQGELIAPK